jgi:hypothetical protein
MSTKTLVAVGLVLVLPVAAVGLQKHRLALRAARLFGVQPSAVKAHGPGVLLPLVQWDVSLAQWVFEVSLPGEDSAPPASVVYGLSGQLNGAYWPNGPICPVDRLDDLSVVLPAVQTFIGKFWDVEPADLTVLKTRRVSSDVWIITVGDRKQRHRWGLILRRSETAGRHLDRIHAGRLDPKP